MKSAFRVCLEELPKSSPARKDWLDRKENPEILEDLAETVTFINYVSLPKEVEDIVVHIAVVLSAE